jgi:hypothetical protein
MRRSLLILLVSLLSAAATVPVVRSIGRSQMPAAPLDSAVAQADLVVVAEVLGMIDTKPEAESRKQFELHRVRVIRTLKGADEADRELRVRPTGVRWEDGRTYILFLKPHDGAAWYEALTAPVLHATEENIQAVSRMVASQGSGVTPKQILTMTHEAGWSGGIQVAFAVNEDGSFQWRERVGPQQGQLTTRTGKLDPQSIALLKRRVIDAAAGPDVDDAGLVTFRWTDDYGQLMSKVYTSPDQTPCSELVKAIRTLVFSEGRP